MNSGKPRPKLRPSPLAATRRQPGFGGSMLSSGPCRLLLLPRWTATAEGLAKAYGNLTGDMLISAGIIAYAGAFTASYRSRIIQSFVDMCRNANIPHTAKFSLTAILGKSLALGIAGAREGVLGPGRACWGLRGPTAALGNCPLKTCLCMLLNVLSIPSICDVLVAGSDLVIVSV